MLAVACGSQPAPKCGSTEAHRVVGVPEAAPPRATEEGVEPPRTIVRTVTLDRERTVLIPDPDCLTPPVEERHLLGYRPLPDAKVQASFFLVGPNDACKASTRGRAELLLARAESGEQKATCKGWRVARCTEQRTSLAVPTPPFRDVSVFARTPNWEGMDQQTDGLGQARRKSETQSVTGSRLLLQHTRDGVVAVMAGDKPLDAFRANVFVRVDGVPYLVTDDALVRLSEPLEYRAMPFLYTSEYAPTPKTHPWERVN